ncbi:pyridoxamine 5'-phosphate oxidase family protein [Maribacter sp. 2307ULW6-5]|uniref:pyridoxamine 5'-phosphate oxidase family protein n=1 Tax=Maribacter sp. 2307ULW6-5 TaxID=3386275 RepID=UPI0039BD7166
MEKIDYDKKKEALKRIRELIISPSVLMMATKLTKIPFSVCPMTLQEMDGQGDLWFFSGKDTDHFRDIEEDNRVQLIYTDKAHDTYLSIFGNAIHIVDHQKRDALWSERLNTWFKGKDDPNLALLNVNMENAYYWENKSNSLVSFFDGELPIGGNIDHKGSKGNVNLQQH